MKPHLTANYIVTTSSDSSMILGDDLFFGFILVSKSNSKSMSIWTLSWLVQQCSIDSCSWLAVPDYILVFQTWTLRHPLEQLTAETSLGLYLMTFIKMVKHFKNVLHMQGGMTKKTFQAANIFWLSTYYLWEMPSSILLFVTRLLCWKLVFNSITSTDSFLITIMVLMAPHKALPV